MLWSVGLQGQAKKLLSAVLHEETGHLSIGLSNGVLALYELPEEMIRPEPEYRKSLFDIKRPTAPYSDLELLHALTMSSDPVTALAVNSTGAVVEEQGRAFVGGVEVNASSLRPKV